MSKTGQSKVFFSDTIFRSLRFESLNDSVYHYTPVETLDDLVYHFVRNDRLDILNESLKKLQGQALYKLYEQTVRRILVLFEDDPGCAFKLATGLITENLHIVRNTPPIEVWLDENYTAEELRVVLLEQILLFGKKYQLVSLLEFMFAEYQRGGIVIKKDEALGMATRRRNHEYDQFFRDNLQD
ncbi:hypothetical protein MHU86_7147 [Fragilaria crotonensis]|nr:hypothetical protein MHU86_7147 [Fragilaria crotonensis]